MDTLERPFGLWTATALVVGGMIGAGIFVLPAALAPVGWTSVVSWLAAGLGVIAIALVLVRLVQQRPDEPSVLTICGDILGLLPGRLLIWNYWTAIAVSLPVLAMTAAAYLLHLLPGVPQSPMTIALVGTAILGLLVLANLSGVRTAGFLQVLTTMLKLLPLALVMLIVLWLAASEPQTFTASEAPPLEWTALTPAMGIVFFALLSFENATLLAERVRDPARNVVRATLLGVIGVLAIYITVSTGIVLAIPTAELQASSAPIAMFVERYVGNWTGNAVALFAAISAIGALNCLVLLLGELPLGMVRDGQLPGWMARTTRRGVAAAPILVGFALAVVLLFASVSGLGETVLDFLLRLTTATAMWFYAGVCLAAIVVRTRPVLALAGLGFNAWVLYGTGAEAALLSVALMLVALPLHFLMGGRTAPRGSVPAE